MGVSKGMVELSRIERVNLGKVWPDEAADFTPWLQENIAQLSEALGMDLAVQEREASVGSFSLDLLAHDTGNNRPVIIENQLGATDHTHLGQLLTYAAGFDASVIVWIAKEYRDEHRAALEFLNGRTGEDTQFFGVVVEVWKIDESRPAVNFDLVAAPNEWRKQTVSTGRTRDNVSERRERYREFFQGLIDTLRQDHQFTNARKAQPQNWYSFSSGRSEFTYGTSFNADGRARVELYIDSGEQERNNQVFDRFEDQKMLFESKLEESLDWERLDSSRASRISIRRLGSIDDNPETLEEVQDWMIEKLLAFKQVFGPKLAELVE